MQGSLVVVAGVGTVGSQIAMELARCGVGHFRLIDGDHLEESNRPRHVLSARYVGMNKAEGMTLHIDDEVPDARAEAEPRHIDHTMSDDHLDRLLEDADLIIVATDDRDAQRRVGRRALALGVTAIFPALYADGGGEVVVQLDPRWPCFFCWDGFRTNGEQLRGVTALNTDAQPIIHLAIQLTLGILDSSSGHQRLLAGERAMLLRQLFVQRPGNSLQMITLTRRPGCPSCGVGPAPLRIDADAWREDVRSVAVSERISAAMFEPRSATRPLHHAVATSGRAFDWADWLKGCIFGAIVMLIPTALLIAPKLHNALTGTEHYSFLFCLMLSVALGTAWNAILTLKE